MSPTRWTAADVPEQNGRVAVITGSNSGIGYEAAAARADRGAQVVLVRYDRATWWSASTASASAAPGMAFQEVTSTPSMSNNTPPIAIPRQ
jgi:NAD(P)-dependent dehydrogenase (short-subunit alcohol dehydrogenase family)